MAVRGRPGIFSGLSVCEPERILRETGAKLHSGLPLVKYGWEILESGRILAFE
jgi:hypothetical protein